VRIAAGDENEAARFSQFLRVASGTQVTMRRYLLLPVILLTSSAVSCAQPIQTITVNWSSIRQAIDGFGAAGAGAVQTLTSAQMNFFYTSSGIGLQWYRMQIYPDLTDCQTDQATIPNGSCVTASSGPTIASSDLSMAQAAVARGARVFASEWSPPGSMKDNGAFQTGGNMIGNSKNYRMLANIQTAFVTLMKGTYSVPIYAISPQNEPEESSHYPSCVWTTTQLHDYIPYLRSGLNTAGHSSVKIMVAEDTPWTIHTAAGPMDDATTAVNVAIVASHGYAVPQPSGPLTFKNDTGQHVWQTEVSDSNPYDGTITSALKYASQIHYYLTEARVNYWGYWLLDANGDFDDNEALTDKNSNIAKRAYAIGNWSRFVLPGWHMVSVTNSASLLVTAFTNPAGNSGTVVAVNNGRSAVSVTFSVGTTMGSSVTPYLTSSSANLAAQTAITVSSGSFSAIVPSHSIETFTKSSTGTQPN
jgi:glucuronoarabinoxylan endo-1,4-beta-xylanase